MTKNRNLNIEDFFLSSDFKEIIQRNNNLTSANYLSEDVDIEIKTFKRWGNRFFKNLFFSIEELDRSWNRINFRNQNYFEFAFDIHKSGRIRYSSSGASPDTFYLLFIYHLVHNQEVLIELGIKKETLKVLESFLSSHRPGRKVVLEKFSIALQADKESLEYINYQRELTFSGMYHSGSSQIAIEKLDKSKSLWEDFLYSSPMSSLRGDYSAYVDFAQNILSEYFGKFFYFFSDGSVISAVDINNHPYCFLVEDKLLPHFPNIVYEYQLDNEYYIESSLVRCFEHFIKSLMKISLNKKNLKFSIINDLPIHKKRSESSQLITYKESDLKSIVEVDGSEVEVEFKFSKLILDTSSTSRHISTLDDGIYFNSTHNQLCIGDPLPYSLSYEVDPSSISALGDYRVSFDYNKVHSFNSLVAAQEYFRCNSFINFEEILNDDISCLSCSLSLEKFNDEELAPGKDETLIKLISYLDSENVNTPDVFEKIIRASFKGFGEFSYYRNSEIAGGGQKRANDLKILRHAGFFLYACSLFIAREDREISFDKWFRKNQEKMTHHICLLLKIENREKLFSKVLTRNTINFLKETLSSFFTSEIILRGESQFFKVNFQENLEELMFFLISIVDTHSKSKVFLKSSHQKFVVQDGMQNSFKIDFFDDEEDYESDIDDELSFIAPMSLSQVLPSLPENFEFLLSGEKISELSEEQIQTEIGVNSESKNKIDWFELHPQIFLNGKAVDVDDKNFSMLSPSIIMHEGSYFKIPKSSIPKVKWLNFFWDKMKGFGEKKERKLGRYLHLPKSQVLSLLAMKWSGIPVIGDQKWREVESNFEGLLNRETDHKNIKKMPSYTLKNYQKTGVQWLLDLHSIGLGGVLADDMGLGKTVQVISFLQHLSLKKNLRTNLVIVPTSLVFNWESELKKFAPKLKVKTFESSKLDECYEFCEKEEGILIATYGLMYNNEKFFTDLSWNNIFFDEAQNIKNMASKRTTVARKLVAASKFCLSGTPMENHYGEFFSLLDLCVPGCLGDYSSFMKSFSSKKMTEGGVREEDLEFLKLKSKPLVLRRIKSDVIKELPTKTESVIHLNFDKKQSKIYKDIAISWNERINQLVEEKGEKKSQLEMLTALMRLRQVCSFPQTIKDVKYSIKSPKLEALESKLLEVCANRKNAIVFTNFYQSLILLEASLKSLGVKVLTIHGKVNLKARKKILEEFSQSESCVLVMTLKTGGVGLNLTNAQYVFHFEPWWNPAAEDQGTDRVYRIGQKSNVHVYRFIMKDSVEEKMMSLKGIKAKAFQNLFSEADTQIDLEKKKEEAVFARSRSLGKSDFSYLLGVDKL